MGQGANTSLTQMLAEELDVAYDDVDLLMGDTDLCPWDRGTFGSMTTRIFGIPFRQAAAEARAVLLDMGSEKLNVPVSALEVKEGTISDKNNPGKSVTYAELVQGKKIEKYLTEKPQVKDPKDFKIVGKSYPRKDSLLKVTGLAKYAGDFKAAGMLYARILRPPSQGAKLISVDTTEAEKVQGIKVIREDDLIAVLHESYDIASEALKKIKADYSKDEPDVDDKKIFAHLVKVAPKGNELGKSGNLDTGRSLSKTIIESEFYNSYVAHAAIETHTALAYMENGRMIVRGSTQTPFPSRESISKALNMAPEQVRVITPFLGGGFGGKSAHQQMVEAARLAKLSGKPVMVVWTRKEEFFFDTFRPAAVVKLISGTDDKGRITLWDYNVYFAGEGGSETIYDIPNTPQDSTGNGLGRYRRPSFCNRGMACTKQ